jgi:hypothetical protein
MVAWTGDHFADRDAAGRALAERVAVHLGCSAVESRPLVVALPRGGVPIGAKVAELIGGDLDVLVVRKIGAPGQRSSGNAPRRAGARIGTAPGARPWTSTTGWSWWSTTAWPPGSPPARRCGGCGPANPAGSSWRRRCARGRPGPAWPRRRMRSSA